MTPGPGSVVAMTPAGGGPLSVGPAATPRQGKRNSIVGGKLSNTPKRTRFEDEESDDDAADFGSVPTMTPAGQRLVT